MDTNEGRESGAMTGQSNSTWQGVSMNGFWGNGEECRNGAISGVNVTVWIEWTEVARDYRPGAQSLGCYCSRPSVKQMPQ